MIRFISYTSCLCIVVIFAILQEMLLRRQNIANTDIKNIDTDVKIPDKVLIYVEIDGKKDYTNVESDLLTVIANVKNGEGKTIPRHGIYNFNVQTEGKKRTVIGVPA